MDTITKYGELIEKILTEYASIPYAYGELKSKVIVSGDRRDYLLITSGFEEDVRVHGCVVHLEIMDDKIWIQRDGTEDGIANELVAAGIPKEDIVLGFHPPELRQYTEFSH